jgi:hypothetical protein
MTPFHAAGVREQGGELPVQGPRHAVDTESLLDRGDGAVQRCARPCRHRRGSQQRQTGQPLRVRRRIRHGEVPAEAVPHEDDGNTGVAAVDGLPHDLERSLPGERLVAP